MRFSKWHALGNTYLLVERAELGEPLSSEGAMKLCEPHTGVGADGVLEVVEVRGPEATVIVWNPDDHCRLRPADLDDLEHPVGAHRSEEHTSELQSPVHLVSRLPLETKKHTK